MAKIKSRLETNSTISPEVPPIDPRINGELVHSASLELQQHLHASHLTRSSSLTPPASDIKLEILTKLHDHNKQELLNYTLELEIQKKILAVTHETKFIQRYRQKIDLLEETIEYLRLRQDIIVEMMECYHE